MTINTILLTILGLFFLLLGANYLIKNIISLANKLNVSPFLISTCTVAFGTTMPELATSLKSILSVPPHPGIAVGNLIGSNIANILLIIGIATIINPIQINFEKLKNLEIKINFFVLLFPSLIIFLNFSKTNSFYLSIIFFLLFIYFVFKRINSENYEKKTQNNELLFYLILKILFCFILLIYGSHFLVNGSVQIAKYFSISERLIGLTLLAIGTSLPELTTAILASVKKLQGIAIGNVLGANMFNILGILSLLEIIKPLSILENINKIDIYFLIISTLLITFFILKLKKINRIYGFFFLSIYILYINLIF
tara:strand:+ start:6666 stop:7598 length:933 start_codon:yes stop_codon:yes gene_type:complete